MSILQIFILLFYLEIFEFNFCSLNKNTKKHILEREKERMIDFTDPDNEIEIQGYDISEAIRNQEQYNDIISLNEEN